MERAKASFAISSVRWQLRRGNDNVLTAECYSDGKITFNRAFDLDDVLTFSFEMARRYNEALDVAGRAREASMAPFEFAFSQPVDLNAFATAVGMGREPMRLWLTEVDSSENMRSFRGVDMHTWDRVLLDIAPDHGYLTIPATGCVNAAPRIATIQGEDNSGRTSIYMDGVELFG